MKLTVPLIALDAFIMRRIAAPVAGKLDYLFGWSQFRIARGLVYVSLFLDTVWSMLVTRPYNWVAAFFVFSLVIWLIVCTGRLFTLRFDEERAEARPELHLFFAENFWTFRLLTLGSFVLLDFIGSSVTPIWFAPLHIYGTLFGMIDYFVYLPKPPEKRERFDWSFGLRRPVPHGA